MNIYVDGSLEQFLISQACLRRCPFTPQDGPRNHGHKEPSLLFCVAFSLIRTELERILVTSGFMSRKREGDPSIYLHQSIHPTQQSTYKAIQPCIHTCIPANATTKHPYTPIHQSNYPIHPLIDIRVYGRSGDQRVLTSRHRCACSLPVMPHSTSNLLTLW